MNSDRPTDYHHNVPEGQNYDRTAEDGRDRAHHREEEDQSIYGIDLFLRCLYDYWLHGGINYFIARKVTTLLKTLALFVVVIVLFYCIDYSALVELSTVPANSAPISAGAIFHGPRATVTSVCWFVGCSAYFAYNLWKTINQIQQAANIRHFYMVQLGVDNDEMLYWMSWHEVCRRLRQFQYDKWCSEKRQHFFSNRSSENHSANSSGEIDELYFREQLFANATADKAQPQPSCREGNDELNMADFCNEYMLSDDDIASMIMRRENYWIAMFADNVLAFESSGTDSLLNRHTATAVADNVDEDVERSRQSDFSAAFAHLQHSTNDNFASLSSDEEDWTESEQRPLFTRPETDQPRTYRHRYNYATHVNTVSAQLSSFGKRVCKAAVVSILKPLFVTRCDEHDTSATLEKPILTKTLQWCLTYGLFGFAIDSQTGALKHELTLFVEDSNTYAERERRRAEQSSIYQSAAQWHRANVSQPLTQKLIWRFRTMAVIGALLSPFIFVLVVLSFFFEHGEEVRREPGRSLGERQWTNEARWAFRRYNELPHRFEARLVRGALAAQRYADSFLFATQGEYARCVAFISAAALTIFLVVGAVGDEEALSLVTFALHRSAFWWITTLSLAVAAARSLVPSVDAIRHETLRRHDYDMHGEQFDEEQEFYQDGRAAAESVRQEARWHTETSDRADLAAVPNKFLPTPTPDQLCEAVARFTGFYPRSWKRKEHTEAIRDRFFCLYDSKWLIYLREIFGIVYTPYLLWFVFPDKAQQFLDFFVERTERRAKVGHVCARENTETVNASEIV